MTYTCAASMLVNPVILVKFLLVAMLTPKPCAGQVTLRSSKESASSDASPTLVPLRKLMVPVRRNGKIVSYKQSFAGDLALGIPGRDLHHTFSMVFDTGSGNVIIPDASCTTAACLRHRRYESARSSTGKAINSNGSPPEDRRDDVTIRFGTGLVSGQFVRDNVCVGVSAAQKPSDARCLEMGVVTATEMSDNPFLEFEFDGIVGLGMSGLAINNQFSFLGRLAATSHGKTQFGIYLQHGDAEAGHELAIAGYNTARFKGPLQWTPVVQPERGFWQVMIKGIRIGNESLDVCGAAGCQAIVDSGSSHLGTPKTWTNDLIEMLSAQSDGTGDCRHSYSPDIHLDFEHFSLTLKTRDYMRKLPTVKTSDESPDPIHTCRPKLTPVSIPTSFGTGHFFILGEPVFTRYYTAFEFSGDQSMIGFGTARHEDDEDDVEDSILLFQVTFTFKSKRATSVNNYPLLLE